MDLELTQEEILFVSCLYRYIKEHMETFKHEDNDTVRYKPLMTMWAEFLLEKENLFGE